MTDLYRLVYTSRNFIEGGEAEQNAAVAGILAVSKRNNARVGVTGALLFNRGSFAQVLEGSKAAVETTFERIQRDTRHSDVAVLQCEPVTARAFPNWSMGFIGDSPRGRALWTEVARTTNFDLSRLEGNVLFTTLLSIVREEEGGAAQTQSDPVPPKIDVAQLRRELTAPPREDHAAPAPVPLTRNAPVPSAADSPALVAQVIEAGVLRTALDEERARTTALRQGLDEAEVALLLKTSEASALQKRADNLQEELEVLRRHRDIWADRARAMAAIMTREPNLESDVSRAAA